MRAPSPTRVSIAVFAVLALLIAGCGSSSDETGGGGEATQGATETSPEATTSTTPSAPSGIVSKACEPIPTTRTLRAANSSCDFARAVATAWNRNPECSSPPGASRYSCRVNSLLCLGTSVNPGIAVSCAESGRAVAFIVKRG